MISASLATALRPGQDAIGRQARLVLYGGIDAEVIGVVPDLHLMDPRTPARPSAYLSDVRFPSDTRDVVLRVSGDPSSIVPALRSAVAGLDAGTPLYQVERCRASWTPPSPPTGSPWCCWRRSPPWPSR